MVVPVFARRFESLGFSAQRSLFSVINGSGDGKKEGGFGGRKSEWRMRRNGEMQIRTAFEKNLAKIKRRREKVITVLGRATIALHKIRDVTDCVKTVPSINFQIQACFYKKKIK